MRIELSKKELEEAIQDYVFKKLGDTAYISGFTGIDKNYNYVNIESIETYVRE